MAYVRDKNGSLRRTIRCGYCCDVGHNKGSCTERKRDLKRSIANYEKDKSTKDSQWTYSIARRELHKMDNKGKNRSCGFCKEKNGHTRRTCPERKQKVIEATEETLFFRKRLCEKFVAAGLGPGALIKISLRDLERDDALGENYSGRLAIVTSIEFESAYPKHRYRGHRWHHHYPRVIHVQMIKPFLSRYGQVYSNMVTTPSVELLNTDNIAVDEDVRMNRSGLQDIISPVLCSYDMMSKDSVDSEITSKQVLKNIVDPR